MQSLSTLLLLFYLISSFYLTAWLAEMWNAWNVWIVLKLQGMHLTACQRETASDPASAYYLLLSQPASLTIILVCVRSLSQGSANAAVLDVTQTGGHKKRVRRSSFLNAKKLYEDAQMARKVKQYLSNLTLETNEESLQTLSIQCEPSVNTCE